MSVQELMMKTQGDGRIHVLHHFGLEVKQILNYGALRSMYIMLAQRYLLSFKIRECVTDAA